MADEKTGVRAPLLIAILARFAFDESARVMVTVYVLCVPSCAKTTAWMAFVPVFRVIAAEAVPEETATPFTFTVARELLVTGVILIDVTVLLTDAVYAVVAETKTGVSVPLLMLKLERFATFERR